MTESKDKFTKCLCPVCKKKKDYMTFGADGFLICIDCANPPESGHQTVQIVKYIPGIDGAVVRFI